MELENGGRGQGVMFSVLPRLNLDIPRWSWYQYFNLLLFKNTLTFSDWFEAKICGGWKVQFLKSQKLERVQAAPTRTRTSRKSSV